MSTWADMPAGAVEVLADNAHGGRAMTACAADAVANWLQETLAGGQPVLRDKVRALAAAVDITASDLRAAQRDLGVECVHIEGLAHLQVVQPRHRRGA